MKKYIAIGIIVFATIVFTPIFLPLIFNQAENLTPSTDKEFVFEDALSINIPPNFVKSVPHQHLIQYVKEPEKILIQAYPTRPNSPQERKDVVEEIYKVAEERGSGFITNELLVSEIDSDTYELIEIVSTSNEKSRQTTLYKLFNGVGIKLTYVQQEQSDGEYISTVEINEVFKSISLR